MAMCCRSATVTGRRPSRPPSHHLPRRVDAEDDATVADVRASSAPATTTMVILGSRAKPAEATRRTLRVVCAAGAVGSYPIVDRHDRQRQPGVDRLRAWSHEAVQDAPATPWRVLRRSRDRAIRASRSIPEASSSAPDEGLLHRPEQDGYTLVARRARDPRVCAACTGAATKSRVGSPTSGAEIRVAVERAFGDGRPLLDDLEEADAYSDILALSTNFDVLDRQYPGSKFILTDRDLDDWLDSRTRHVETNIERRRSRRVRRHVPRRRPPGLDRRAHRTRRAGSLRTSPAVRRSARPRHRRRRRVGQVCPFLGLPVPDAPFPRRG